MIAPLPKRLTNFLPPVDAKEEFRIRCFNSVKQWLEGIPHTLLKDLIQKVFSLLRLVFSSPIFPSLGSSSFFTASYFVSFYFQVLDSIDCQLKKDLERRLILALINIEQLKPSDLLFGVHSLLQLTAELKVIKT